jgi:thioredoxin 1
MNNALAFIVAGLGCLATQSVCFACQGNQDQLVAEVSQLDSDSGDSVYADLEKDGRRGSDGRGHEAVGTNTTSSPSGYREVGTTYESLRVPLNDYISDVIKKDGNANKNHLVMISATWCAPCNRMLPLMEQLKKEGFIIYVFKVDKKGYEDYARLYKAKLFPTFLVYDGGKEVNRTTGSTTTEKWFRERLKKDVPKKPDNPYENL